VLKKLEKKPSIKTIQGVPSYDIMDNERYMKMFMYSCPSNPLRNEIIEGGSDTLHNNYLQSDYVYCVLKIAFMTRNQFEKYVEIREILKRV